MLGLSGAALCASAAPTGADYTVTLNGGRSLNIDLAAWVTLPSGTQVDPGSLTVVTPPAHGTATIADGEVFYTANLGFSGTDTFKYTIADTAKNVSNVATATVNVTLPASTYTPVIFGGYANIQAIAAAGSPAQNGGIDHHGYAYSAAQLGSSVTVSGETFQLGAATGKNALSNGAVQVAQCELISECSTSDTRPLRFSSLKILATGVNGAQQNQQVCLSYDDGYRQTPTGGCTTISLSDWRTPQHFPGETVATSVPNRVTPSGTQQAGPWYVYEYTIPVDPSRTLLDVQTPANPNVVVLSMNLEPVTTPTARPVLMNDIVNVVATSSGNDDAGSNTGLDGHGDTFDTAALGSYVVSQDVAFQVVSPLEITGDTGMSRTSANPAAVNSFDYVVEYGFFSRLYLLGTGFNGDQINQPVVITYADGSKATTLLSFSDWRTPAHYPGETIATTSPFRWRAYTTRQQGPWYTYSYSVPLDRTRKIASVTLPNADVVILGMTLLP